MKLEVSQGLWASNTFAHDVRVALVLDKPATIWTGAADGKIFLWSFDSRSSSKDECGEHFVPEDVLPLALLCGHTAAIVGLQACDRSQSQSQGGVLSVCSERGMCVWDSDTGKCLRRRRLPPSIAQPTSVSRVPGETKHICVGYHSSSSGQAKGGVLVVDTSTLRVTQNIYHGLLGLREINDLVVVAQQDEFKATVADLKGNFQVWSKNKSGQEGAEGDLHVEAAEAVSLSNDGKLLLLVSPLGWMLRSLENLSIYREDGTCLVGGYFLRDVEKHQFLVWDGQGSATVYSVEGSNSVARVSVVPGLKGSAGCKITFCSIGDIIVRIDYNREASVAVWTSSWKGAATGRASFGSSGRLWKGLETANSITITSSLLVPSYGTLVPSIFVCGYANGDFDLIKLEPGRKEVHASENGPSIQCLAVHQSELRQVLLSGSMDGSVCLWDIEAGNRSLIAVLHPHVAPVRQFVLPSPESSPPWDECFVSVADDSTVALSSLTSLRTERIFPGHAGVIQQVVWDEFRAYLAVLCTAGDGQLVLYIWDIHSGARERILRGAAAQSMLKHFASRKRRTTELHGDFTSASSLLLPLDDVHSPMASQEMTSSQVQGSMDPHCKQHAIRAGCPFPGIAAIHFDMTSLLSTVDEKLLKLSLSVLHFWGIDEELDKSVADELQVFQPRHHRVAAGIAGNRGSVTLILPTKEAASKFWSRSSVLFSMRALTMVSLAQRLLTFSAPGSMICSALAAFYTAGAVEKLGDACLEIFACFWQDPAEHVRLAARLLFHSAASTAVPDILQNDNGSSFDDLLEWLESSGGQETWLGLTGGSDQDGRACRIIMCGALAIWHKSLVRHDLSSSTAPLLLKLVRTSDRHSATAAEVLCAGMASTWQPLIQSEEVSQLTSDVLFLIQCIGGDGDHGGHIATTEHHRALLSALALADMPAFLIALERVASTKSSSSVLLGLTSLVQVIRTSPSTVIACLGRIVSLAVRLLDPADSLQRRHNFPIIMEVIKEMSQAFPMVALYHPVAQSAAGKLAVGDPVGDIRSLRIHVYDLYSASIMKVLDASGPPGHPALSPSARSSTRTLGITALSFSNDGEGLVAFSHQGLILRWWSVGAAWWDKLSRSTVPVQCTKLVLLPPSPGFSPKSSSTSIIGNLSGSKNVEEVEEESESEETIDLSFRLHWKSDRIVILSRGNHQVGVFQL
ncbi:uncharacterized protein LOC9643384 isoform X1 [Selaginella moellendorffii]|uniref:uncharacterized protein LOC9643384 isoform X1 n=1 Tax=Selaginella moellendorffii TaxID=88036 RepID=UPI000D1C31E4|nr:uncharacterized protein LOC9643384 isoform X1 [Selaginella moellendorffii]|eukprot:XP_024521936.1 uncharacterized protein LOC9643384 isoform X1 [Selaginella moellendorffii]